MKAIKKSWAGVTKIVFIVSVLLCTLLMASYAGFRMWIQSDINQFSGNALNQYGGDRVEALIAVLNSETESLKNKNDAIWTLSYIGDERALPVLRNLQTFQECNHSKQVCQRELKRAIAQIEGKKFTIMSFK